MQLFGMPGCTIPGPRHDPVWVLPPACAGYKEEGVNDLALCEDELDAETCAIYVESGDCEKGAWVGRGPSQS